MSRLCREMTLWIMLSSVVSGAAYAQPQKPAARKLPVNVTGPVTYNCAINAKGAAPTAGADTLIATFYGTTPAMVLVEYGGRTRPAFQVRAASGAKYEGQDVLFWEARGEAMVTWAEVELTCRPHRVGF